MEFGLQENILIKIRDIFKQYKDIEKVYIYGSRARGDFVNTSDIDFAICGKKFRDISKLRFDLEDLSIIYTIDLVHLDTLTDKNLMEQIKRHGKIFYLR